MTVWLTVTSRDGYDTLDIGPFPTEADARAALLPALVGRATISDGVELDSWEPGRGWEGEE